MQKIVIYRGYKFVIEPSDKDIKQLMITTPFGKRVYIHDKEIPYSKNNLLTKKLRDCIQK